MYVINTDSNCVHQIVEGMTREACNVDQIKHKEEYHLLEALKLRYPTATMCKRCFK